jgi:hypothetical protein
MTQLKRKFVTILLFTTLVAPLVVTTGWLNYKKYQLKRTIKHQMIAGIEKEKLVLLVVDDTNRGDLEWEHSREFEFEGEMYDVVYTEVTGDTTKYWCWLDHEETDLNKQLSTALTDFFDNNPEKKANESFLVHLYKSLFFERIPQVKLFRYHGKPHQHQPHGYLCYSSLSQRPLTPPPRM